MHQNILVPTDGSDECLSALEEALDLAETYDATVHALYVMDETTRGNGLMALDSPRPSSELRDVGEQATDEIAAQATDAGVGVTTEVRPGIPYETIVEYAEETDIDVIVMSSHGRTGVQRFIFGSVTERVTRNTEIPVVVVQRESSASESESEATTDTPAEATYQPSSMG